MITPENEIIVNCPDCGAWLFSMLDPQQWLSGAVVIPCDGCPAWWQVTVHSDGCMSFEVAPLERRWDKDAD